MYPNQHYPESLQESSVTGSYAILTFPPLSAGPGISHNSPCSNPLCLTVIEKIKQDDVRVLPEWELAWQLLLNNSC